MSTQGYEVVIIGGGAVGCGVAYSLAQAGITDVLLIEKQPTVASVTTSQAAGLVGQVRNTVERTQLAMWSGETFRKLQRESDHKPSWSEVGSLRIALSDQRAAEFDHMKSVADESGLQVEYIDKQTAEGLWPLMRFDRATAILWCPTDGYLQPSDLTMAYVGQARKMGVEFRTNVGVVEVLVDQGRVVGVRTDANDNNRVDCKTVINAAGSNAFQIAKSVGLELPIVPVRHEFFVTVAADGLIPSLPVVRIPDATLYMRAETNALLCGGWEPSSLSVDPRTIAVAGEAPVITDDWLALGGFAEQLAPHLPQVEELGIRSVFKGWPTFTPDGRFIIGESEVVRGFVMAGGCNAHGVSGSAGIGRHVVESIVSHDPSDYVKSLSPDRFLGCELDWETARAKAMHYYETYYHLGH